MGNQQATFQKTLSDLKKNDPSKSDVNFANFPLGEAKVKKLCDALKENNTVQKLDLSNTNCNAAAIRHVADTLSNSLVPSNIHTLILDNNPIGPAGARYIAQVLSSAKRLMTVKMNNCAIGDEGIIALVKGIDSGTTVLSNLEVGNNGAGDKAAQAVGQFLRHNESLEGISLWKNGMTASGVKKLFEGVGVNRTLQWIGVGGNPIGAEGAKHITAGLSTNQTLQWLAAGGCEFGDQGVMYLSAVLKDDTCDLQSIGLGGNGIGAEGMYHLCRALWTNTRLENLGLGGNYIDGEGCEHIAEMLKANKTLKKIILSSNLVDDDAMAALVQGLSVNNSINTLLLAGNPFGDLGARRIVDAVINKNKSLKVLDIHNSEMSENTERAVVEKLKRDSKLYLLGSYYGRQDYRVADLNKDWNPVKGDDSKEKSGADNDTTLRHQELF
jgi:hypothetical protein